MGDAFEVRDKLYELSNRVDDYKTCHKNILTTKEEYIDLREREPRKKKEKNVKKPFNSTPVRVAILVVLLLCITICAFCCVSAFFLYLIGSVCSIFGVPVVGIIAIVFIIIALAFCSVGAFGVSVCAFLLVGEVIYNLLSKHLYKRAVKKYRENKSYNENEYPILLGEYNKQREILSQEYDDIVQKSYLKIDTDEAFFKENGGVIAKKYYLDLDRIIAVIDDQRAYKLNDAINLVIRDKRIENASKQKKKEKPECEELYPCDIMVRARVFAGNCQACPNNNTCIKLFCRMNEYFKKQEEERLDDIIHNEHQDESKEASAQKETPALSEGPAPVLEERVSSTNS